MTRRNLAAALALAALAGGALAQGGAARFDLTADRLDAPPAGFTFARTGGGAPGRWVVKLDPTSPAGDHVLAQVDGDPTDYRFPVAVAEAPVLKDLRAEVRCRPVAGRGDQACGLVVRYRDAGNYYVARANALEGNVNLYRVVGGRRQELAGWSGPVASGAWHALALEARGDRLTVSWEGKPVVQATDRTFGEAGRVGVWTKADSITHFAALTVTPLP
jgi:hypothetical protein